MNIIGLVGKKTSGKDSVFKIIWEMWNTHKIDYRPIRLSFADSLKQDLCDVFGCSMDDLNRLKNESEVVRKVLQYYGTGRRNEQGDYWINKVREAINSYESRKEDLYKRKLYVITDVRFINEASFVRSLGGKLVKVTRPEQSELNLDTHISETELTKIGCDLVINNDGSLKTLELPVIYTMEQLGYIK